jgi:hypothetical protein
VKPAARVADAGERCLSASPNRQIKRLYRQFLPICCFSYCFSG